jgi:5-formyltetrahydrofolate cyclo-ligase
LSKTTSVDSLLLPRLTPPVAPVRERRSVTAQAGSMSKSSSPDATVDDRQAQTALRKVGRAARAGLSLVEREKASRKIADTVIRSAWFRRSKFVACYLPMHDEVDTWPLIDRAWRMKKRIFAPVIKKNFAMEFREFGSETTLVFNEYGLPEPQDGEIIRPRALDVVITPMVAFDDDGNRVGMGGGYFDRTFSFLRHRKLLFHPKLIGLAYSCQRVEKIAPNPWDIRVFRIVDETT